MHRYDLTDAQWALISPFFPDRYHHGQADIPGTTTGPWSTASCGISTPTLLAGRPRTLRTLANGLRPVQPLAPDGTWAEILDALLLRLDDDGLIDRDLWCVDASVIRASRAAAGAKKKSRQAAAVGGA